MTRANGGWINTTKPDRLQEFWTSNIPKRPIYENKVQHLPSLNMHYDTPRSPTKKQWTDQSLLSTRSVNTYLAESDAFQRASFVNIVEKWKQRDRNKTTELIASFDIHYNMKRRFLQDKYLNRPSEVKYAPVAKYYRFLGNESNPKNNKPCVRHKRRTREYEDRHLRELLKLSQTIKTRNQLYFLPKIIELPPIETTTYSSPTVRSFESVGKHSNRTFS